MQSAANSLRRAVLAHTHVRPTSRSRSLRIHTSAPTKQKWSTGPAPPRLPKEEQEIFEKLQQQSSGAFSTSRQSQPLPEHTEADHMDEAELNATLTRSAQVDSMLEHLKQKAQVAAKGDGEELHPNVRRGAPPEFEGDINPKTGEVGGPKNDPLRHNDWSYNGRVTDF